MIHKWAYPIGHEDVTVDPIIGRTYYQPVPERDDTLYCDGCEFYLNPDNNGDALYALTSGEATYTYVTLPDGQKIGRLELRVDGDFAIELAMDNRFFTGVPLGKIIYSNMLHSSFVNSLSALIDSKFGHTAQEEDYSIVDTIWNDKKLHKALGTSKNTAYQVAKASFIYAVLDGPVVDSLPTAGIKFKLAAGDKFGNAGPVATRPAGVPASYTMVQVSAIDSFYNAVNISYVIQALCLTSYGKLSLQGDFEALSYRRVQVKVPGDQYTPPLLNKLGITAAATVTNEQPPVATTAAGGQVDIRIEADLFDWHSGTKSMVEWRYNEADNNGTFKFEVRLRDSTKSVMPGNIPIKVLSDFTKPYPTIITSHSKETWVSFPGMDSKLYQDRVANLYTKYKDVFNNIGRYLKVPEELLIAIACHESGGLPCPVRFEPISYFTKAGKVANGDAATELTALGYGEGANSFVARYNELTIRKNRTGFGGASVDDISFLRKYPNTSDLTLDDTKLDDKIKTRKDAKGKDFSITWREYFKVLKACGKGSKFAGKVSPGIAQTILTTAQEDLDRIKRDIKKDSSIPAADKSTVLSKMGMGEVPDEPQDLFIWLTVPVNSFITGAAVMREKRSGRHAKWDLVKLIAAYNSGSVSPAVLYAGNGTPVNPWGLTLNDELYLLEAIMFYNMLRDTTFLAARNIKFAGKLVKDTTPVKPK